MCWWHAAGTPEPPHADSRRHPGVNRSFIARAPQGNRRPKLSTALSPCLSWPAWRSQSCPHTPIRTPPIALHRNLLLQECCDDQLSPPSIQEHPLLNIRALGYLATRSRGRVVTAVLSHAAEQ